VKIYLSRMDEAMLVIPPITLPMVPRCPIGSIRHFRIISEMGGRVGLMALITCERARQ